jgi:hypothetical protein
MIKWMRSVSDPSRQPKLVNKSCAILGVWEIGQSLVENLNSININSLDLVQEMIAQEFPDLGYNQSEEGSAGQTEIEPNAA